MNQLNEKIRILLLLLQGEREIANGEGIDWEVVKAEAEALLNV